MDSPRRKPGDLAALVPPVRRWLIVGLALLAGSVVAARSTTADAQELPEYQLQRFRPATGPADYLDVYSTGIGRKLEPTGGLYLDFADAPLRVRAESERSNEPVQSQMTASFFGNVALTNRLAVGLLLPATILQTGENLEPIVTDDATVSGTSLQPQALNDFRISGKYQIFNLLTHQYGLAAVTNVYVPTGTQNTLTGDRSFGFDVLAVGETWLWRGARASINLGYRYRSVRHRFRSATMGDEILWGIAGRLPVVVQNFDIIAEIDGGVSVATDDFPGSLRPGEMPTEFRTAGRIRVTENWTLTAGVGSRIGNGIGVPDVRGIVGIGGHWVSGGNFSYDYDNDGIYGSADKCPHGKEDHDNYRDSDGCPDPDNDGDGVRDVNDQCRNTPAGAEVDKHGCVDNDIDGDGLPNKKDECPRDPEDYDDFEDGDGCPDPDNDGDGISDLADKCPGEKETHNGYRDEDGCPDKPGENIRVANDKIIINHKIHFETGKAKIQEQSHEILDELAQVLQNNPQISLVRIEGHTDNRGSKSYNRDLSNRRAESVRDYLINHGLDPQRLAATGYGESQPIAPNDTAEGRRRNRRVEFDILQRGED